MTTAVLFQALPPLSPTEYSELEQDILKIGIQVPIVKDENGIVIDGHHRQKISIEHGLDCPFEVKRGLTDTQKRDLALSLNLKRRHLNQEQKRALVAESIKADPQLSDRAHGRRTGVHNETVAAARKRLIESGEVTESVTSNCRVDPRTGNASQPASKPPRPPTPDGPRPESAKADKGQPTASKRRGEKANPDPAPSERSKLDHQAEADLVNAVSGALKPSRIKLYSPGARKHFIKVLTMALEELRKEESNG